MTIEHALEIDDLCRDKILADIEQYEDGLIPKEELESRVAHHVWAYLTRVELPILIAIYMERRAV